MRRSPLLPLSGRDLVLPRWRFVLPGGRFRRVRRGVRRGRGSGRARGSGCGRRHGRRACRLALLRAGPRRLALLGSLVLLGGGRLPGLGLRPAPSPVVLRGCRRGHHWRGHGSGDRLAHGCRSLHRGRRRWWWWRRRRRRRRRRRAVCRGGRNRPRDLAARSNRGERGRCRGRWLEVRVRARPRDVRCGENQRRDMSPTCRCCPGNEACGGRMQNQEGDGRRPHDRRAGGHERPDCCDPQLHPSSAPSRHPSLRRLPPYRREAANP